MNQNSSRWKKGGLEGPLARVSKGIFNLAQDRFSARRKLEEDREDEQTFDDRIRVYVSQSQKDFERIKDNQEELRRWRQRAAVSSLRRDMDREIHRAYYKDGGIRFYAELLLQYMEHILSPEATVENMWIGAYNSYLFHMRTQLEELEKKLAAMEDQVRSAYNAYQELDELQQAIGCTDCMPLVNELRNRRSDDPAQLLQLRLNKLEQTVQANTEAVEEALRQCWEAGDQPSRSLENQPLLDALRRALAPETLEKLSVTDGWTDEDYRSALTAHTEEIRTALLDQFFPPE